MRAITQSSLRRAIGMVPQVIGMWGGGRSCVCEGGVVVEVDMQEWMELEGCGLDGGCAGLWSMCCWGVA